MRYIRLPLWFVVLSVLGSLVHTVRAHDPGLSVARLRLANSQLAVHLTFARRDIETLVPIDMNHDGTVTVEEFAAALPHLRTLAGSVLELSLDDQRIAEQVVAVELDDSDALHVQLTFLWQAGSRLRVSVPIMARLARGHRQYVSVRDYQENLVVDHVLDADQAVFALPLVQADTVAQKLSSFCRFLRLGVEHIVTGYDHLLFLFGLLVVGSSLRSAAKIITSFTGAHSITLALATFNVVHLPSSLVEPLIAVSIIYVGLENLWRRDLQRRWLLTFGFGLIHGLGFASVLRDLGIGGSGAIVPLLAFNSGVELGQMAIALLILPLMWQAQQLPRLFPGFTIACSTLVTLAGAYWLLERTVLS
jgi:hydrogenase/urease accessory protein HupE